MNPKPTRTPKMKRYIINNYRLAQSSKKVIYYTVLHILVCMVSFLTLTTCIHSNFNRKSDITPLYKYHAHAHSSAWL